MKRRKVISAVTLTMGATLLLPAGLFSGCKTEDYQGQFFNQSSIDLLNEIGETILPETADSPGAKLARVGNFLDAYIAQCYTTTQRKLVQDGLITFNESCLRQYKKSFMKMSKLQQHDFIVKLDIAGRTHDAQIQENETPHYFPMLKSAILFAYFTSQEGATKALRYVPVPGKYVGNYAFSKGEKAWAL